MHIALVSPHGTGHYLPAMTLAGTLQARGHTITYVAPPSAKPHAERRGFGFRAVLVEENEEMEGLIAIQARLSGFKAMKYTLIRTRKRDQLLLRDLPIALKETGVDAVLFDEILYLPGSSVGRLVGIPFGFFSVSLTMAHQRDGPPFFSTWHYSLSLPSLLRDEIAWRLIQLVAHLKSSFGIPQINEWRVANGLPAIAGNLAPRSDGLIQVCQQPAFFEFPKSGALPDHYFYSSPWHDLQRESSVSFPFEKLDPTKKLVYVSLGTMQNKDEQTWRNICKACVGIPGIQLVVGLGNPDLTLDLAPEETPEDILIVGFAPQLQLLRRAALMISHCGTNTALEAIACGVPAVGIPVVNDQPGVAARWSYLGAVCLVGRPQFATVARIRRGVLAVLPDDSPYRQKAKELRKRLEEEAPSMDQTAAILELALGRGASAAPLRRDDPSVLEILSGKRVEPDREAPGAKRRIFQRAGASLAAVAALALMVRSRSRSS